MQVGKKGNACSHWQSARPVSLACLQHEEHVHGNTEEDVSDDVHKTPAIGMGPCTSTQPH